MHDDRKLSPDEIFQELGISPYVLIVWEKRGLLPSSPNARRRRYDLQSVQAIRDRNGLPRHPSMLEEPNEPDLTPAPKLDPKPELQTETTGGSAADLDWRGRRVAKVRGLGPLRLSKNILAAQEAAEKSGSTTELDALLDRALTKLLGVGRVALTAELHRRREGSVAAFLGISVRRLREICKMYNVCAPDDGYWLSQRVQVAPNQVPFAGLLDSVAVARDVE